MQELMSTLGSLINHLHSDHCLSWCCFMSHCCTSIHIVCILCTQISAFFVQLWWIRAIMCMWIMMATERDYPWFFCARNVWCCQCCHGSWFWRWLMTWAMWKMRICSISFTASTSIAMRTSGNSNRSPGQLNQWTLL